MTRRLTLDDYPWQGTHDPDGALRALIARQLARQTFRVMGARWPGRVVEGHEPLPDGVVSIHEEWSEPEQAMQLPALVILDGAGEIAAPPLSAAIDEATLWPLEGDALEHLALRGEGEFQVTYEILAQATDRVTRRALLLGAWSALSGALDYDASGEDRFGLLLEAGDLYWGRRARIEPLGFGRLDSEDSAGKRHRVATLRVRASIPIVSPVLIPAITETPITDPLPGDAELALDMTGLGVGEES